MNNLKECKIEEVEKDGNCGYRALSLQIYNDENSYNLIRTHVYTFLNTNLDFYKDKYTTLNNEAIKAEDYIPHVKTDGFWMVDLELSIINIIYDINLLIFKKNIKTGNINLLKIYGDIKDISKNIITIWFVDNNHFTVLYENNRKCNIISNIAYNNLNYIKNYLKYDKKYKFKNQETLFNTNLLYANDNRKIKYKDIINYIKKSESNESGRFPEYIYNIISKSKRKNAKKAFKRSIKNYYIDKNHKD